MSTLPAEQTAADLHLTEIHEGRHPYTTCWECALYVGRWWMR
jgi:hypothetical protein